MQSGDPPPPESLREQADIATDLRMEIGDWADRLQKVCDLLDRFEGQCRSKVELSGLNLFAGICKNPKNRRPRFRPTDFHQTSLFLWRHEIHTRKIDFFPQLGR